MPEYIEREALIQRLESSINSWGRDCNSNAPTMVTAYQDVLHRVNNIPSADVVEVVRCIHCIHFKTNISKENYCNIHSTTWDKFYVKYDDFCSLGESRGANNDN